MKNLFILLSFFGLFSFCSKNVDSQTLDNLIGKWEWVKSSGGIAGVTKTPENTSSEIMVEFTTEKFIKFMNGDTIQEISYKIEIGKSIRKTEDTNLIIYEDGRIQSYEINGSTLLLFDECYDCFQNEYIREE